MYNYNKANGVVEAFSVSIADYVGGVLGVSNSVNFYNLVCAYKKAHKDEVDDFHLEMLNDIIKKAMAAMDAAFANEKKS